MNILNIKTRSAQLKIRTPPHKIEAKANNDVAPTSFATRFETKYPWAVQLLQKDEEERLAFYSFSVGCQQLLQADGQVKSTFDRIRHRTKYNEDRLSRGDLRSTVTKLRQYAHKIWCRLRNFDILLEIIFQSSLASLALAPLIALCLRQFGFSVYRRTQKRMVATNSARKASTMTEKTC